MALLLEPKDWKLIKSRVEKGYLLALPTETVYGLAGNAYSRIAVEKIFKLKKRPTFLLTFFYKFEINEANASISSGDAARQLV